MKILNKTHNTLSVNLLCKNCKTCPTISIDVQEDSVIVEDDYNSTIKMSLENFTELANQIRLGAFDDYIQ